MDDDDVIAAAIVVLERRMQVSELPWSSEDTKTYLTLKLSDYDREVFAVLLLDARHRMIEYVELFYGTVDKAVVYPREIARRALQMNASAIVLAHNHPSGVSEPSPRDVALTEQVRKALALIDVRILDHLIIGAKLTTSLAERGLL